MLQRYYQNFHYAFKFTTTWLHKVHFGVVLKQLEPITKAPQIQQNVMKQNHKGRQASSCDQTNRKVLIMQTREPEEVCCNLMRTSLNKVMSMSWQLMDTVSPACTIAYDGSKMTHSLNVDSACWKAETRRWVMPHGQHPIVASSACPKPNRCH